MQKKQKEKKEELQEIQENQKEHHRTSAYDELVNNSEFNWFSSQEWMNLIDKRVRYVV